MKVNRLTLGLALPVTLLLLVSSAMGTTAGRKIRQAPGPINALAMDGSRIAYDVGNARDSHGVGNKILVWNLLTGKTIKVSGKRTSQADITSTGAGVRELAIAGKRVAWIINLGGMSESDDYLCVSSVVKPKELKLAEVTRVSEEPSQYSPGKWISGLVGSGNMLAVNRWTQLDGGQIVSGGLDLVGPRGLTRIARGPTTVLAKSADAGRIAVLRSDGTLGIYSTAGRLLLSVTPSPAQKIALHGKYLVVLTKTRTLEVYDSHTGSLLKTLPVRGNVKGEPGNLDVQGSIAVYTVSIHWSRVVKPEVRVVNLKTGKDKLLARMEGRGVFGGVFAQIEQPGLVYASNVGNRPTRGSTTGRLVFVPFARAAAAVS
jgi:hypothetical protein